MKNGNVYPYIPNTAPQTRAEMMREIGITDVEQLFEVIPEHLRIKGLLNLPEPMLDEYSVRRHTERLLSKNLNANEYACFLGAGCAPHFVPAVVDEIITRGENLTSFAGSSMCNHGLFQTMFEFQSQMGDLLEMDFVGPPMFDSTVAAGHSLRIAVRVTGRKKVILAKSVNPETQMMVSNYLKGTDEDFAEIMYAAYEPKTGLIDLVDLKQKLSTEVAAVLIENPTFFGAIETQAAEIGKLAREYGAEFIVYTDPISLGVMEPPVKYGASMVVGDLHSLGLHMSAGGGVAGFVGLPDDPRYVGKYKDTIYSICDTLVEGELGFYSANYMNSAYGSRDKGNDFTGTGASLHGLAAGVYLSLMGPQGMLEVGNTIMKKAQYAARKLEQIPAVQIQFTGPFFKEFVVNFNLTGKTVAEINKQLLAARIFGGKDLSASYPELGQCALYCVTEIHTQEDIDHLVSTIAQIVG